MQPQHPTACAFATPQLSSPSLVPQLDEKLPEASLNELKWMLKDQGEDALALLKDLIFHTIPNLIAINWEPEGGQNMLEALVKKVAARLPLSEEPIPKVAKQQTTRRGSVGETKIVVAKRQTTRRGETKIVEMTAAAKAKVTSDTMAVTHTSSCDDSACSSRMCV